MAKVYPQSKRVVIIQQGSGDRDVSYLDSIALSDTLSGTLGPVRAPDAFDLADTFVADDLTLGDTLAASDALRPISDVVLADSIAIDDRLAGTLGPVVAPDSFDLADTLDAGPLVLGDSFDAADSLGEIQRLQVADSVDLNDRLAGTLGPVTAPDSLDVADSLRTVDLTAQDSLSISDAPQMPDIDAQAVDSIDLSDRIGQIHQIDDDSLHVSDSLRAVDSQVRDSLDASDFLRAIDGPSFAEMLDFSDAADVVLSADAPDSMAIGDALDLSRTRFADSIDISDSRKVATVTTARYWPNTQISNTGFTTPANWIDTNEATAAVLTIAQTSTLLSGNTQTLNGTLIVSCADINVSPTPTISNAVITMAWSTTASGGLQSGNAVNMQLQYSLNDGGSWTTVATVTTVAGSGAPTAAIGITYAQLNQLRFRATGSVTSGTTAVLGGATQTFNALYARIQFDASQTL